MSWPRTNNQRISNGFAITVSVGATLLLAASLAWNMFQLEHHLTETALTVARTAWEKDVLFRRWNATLGGVYAPVTPVSEPNPYLETSERDITTPGGQALTKINPAYMTRQVHELGSQAYGILGHITSLKPIRPQNAADPWEKQALERAEKTGAKEISQVQYLDGKPYLRMLRPLETERPCLACHAKQGYKLGEMRGGISVSVPLAPLRHAVKDDRNTLIATHLGLWLASLLGIWLGWRITRLRIMERDQARQEVQTLSGLLPICASCKRIRDDQGQWQRLEQYISQRSQADFSHSICPECSRKLYPDLQDE